MGENSSTSEQFESKIDPELTRHDAIVRSALRDLTLAAQAHEYAVPMVRAARTIRVASYTDGIMLSPRQKAELVDVLGTAYKRMCRRAADGSSILSVTAGANALGTLILSWSGDHRWVRGGGPFLLAAKFALAFELELIAAAIWDGIAADQQQMIRERAQLFDGMLETARPN